MSSILTTPFGFLTRHSAHRFDQPERDGEQLAIRELALDGASFLKLQVFRHAHAIFK
jgi:hypothetical protein